MELYDEVGRESTNSAADEPFLFSGFLSETLFTSATGGRAVPEAAPVETFADEPFAASVTGEYPIIADARGETDAAVFDGFDGLAFDDDGGGLL